MALTVVTSGTTAALTLTVEASLATETPGTPTDYWAAIDCAALVAGEVLFIVVYTKVLTGGTERVAYASSFVGGSDLDMVQYTVPVPTDISWRIGITQQNGTGRTFPWKIFSI